jgi:tripartite-type tricarboxylate transporter receptor subunit TctC
MLKSEAQVKIQHIPYKGSGPALIDLMAGRVVGMIDALEGAHYVIPGDWIITGVKGEHYPCKPDIFEMTYEPAGESNGNNT